MTLKVSNGNVQIYASSANAAFAERIALALHNSGYEIQNGEFDPETVMAVIVVWTGYSIASKSLTTAALDPFAHRALAPVSIGLVEPPDPFKRLAPMNLAGWQGDIDDPRWRVVIEEIEAIGRRRAGVEGIGDLGITTAPTDRQEKSARPMPEDRDENTPRQDAPAFDEAEKLRTHVGLEERAGENFATEPEPAESEIAQFKGADPAPQLAENAAEGGVIARDLGDLSVETGVSAPDGVNTTGGDHQRRDDAGSPVDVEEDHHTENRDIEDEAFCEQNNDAADDGAIPVEITQIPPAALPNLSAAHAAIPALGGFLVVFVSGGLLLANLAGPNAAQTVAHDVDAAASMAAGSEVSSEAAPSSGQKVAQSNEAALTPSEDVLRRTIEDILLAEAKVTDFGAGRDAGFDEIGFIGEGDIDHGPVDTVDSGDMDAGDMDAGDLDIGDEAAGGVVADAEIVSEEAIAIDEIDLALAEITQEELAAETKDISGDPESETQATPVADNRDNDQLASLIETVAAPTLGVTTPPINGNFFRECTQCPDMAVAPAGSFTFGAPRGELARIDAERPTRSVVVEKRFAIGTHEVTFAQWDACVKDGGCRAYNPRQAWGRGRQPVINVSWEDAQSYVDWLSAKTGANYRLPTEIEWEYAARAGAGTAFSFGDSLSPDRANYNGGFPYRGPKGAFRAKTTPVASFEPNAFGLFDMHGNVWEWTTDCWRETHAAPAQTGACAERVVKGGAWNTGGWRLRSAHRLPTEAGAREIDKGFRVARDME